MNVNGELDCTREPQEAVISVIGEITQIDTPVSSDIHVNVTNQATLILKHRPPPPEAFLNPVNSFK